MYERMLNKQIRPTIEEMTKYCKESSELFTLLNDWMATTFETEQTTVFPYGNSYGWGIAHRKKGKLICNVFAEDNAFTVMVRLSEKQCKKVYEQLQNYAKELIDNKYPCNDGGWIHYRISCQEELQDIQKILSVRCSK
jgi:hypothetical protein